MTRQRPLTSRTRIALAIARAVAAGRGDTALTPAHVVIGIGREGAGAALAALWYAGMSMPDIRALAGEDPLGEPSGRPAPREVAIGSSPGEDEILRLSDAEADQLGDEYLGTEHILLAILRSRGDVASSIIAKGVTVERYLKGLQASRRGDPPPSEPMPQS